MQVRTDLCPLDFIFTGLFQSMANSTLSYPYSCPPLILPEIPFSMVFLGPSSWDTSRCRMSLPAFLWVQRSMATSSLLFFTLGYSKKLLALLSKLLPWTCSKLSHLALATSLFHHAVSALLVWAFSLQFMPSRLAKTNRSLTWNLEIQWLYINKLLAAIRF